MLNKAILQPEVQKFINENLKTDLPQLILKGSPFPDISIQELAAQIESKRKAKKKIHKIGNHLKIKKYTTILNK